MNKFVRARFLSMLMASVSLLTATNAFADDTSAASPTAAPAKSKGILPIPDFSGDLASRSYLMGDLGGVRSAWGNNGANFNVDTYTYIQSVTDGGVDTGTENGGVIDVNLTIDFDRMGLIPGGIFQMQAVSRYGDSVNGISGSAMPVNSNATTPTTSPADKDATLYLPVFNYTQFLSAKLALLVGKINTYPQANEFSSGSGQSQYWNLNLVAPVSPALMVPYSALVAGAVILPKPGVVIQIVTGTSTDTSKHSGFNYIDDGKFGLAKVEYQYQIDKLPGGFTNVFMYGWDSDFLELNGRIDLGPGGLELTTEDSTWANSFDVWQYLWVEEGQGQAVDVNNGRQDLQGVGVFSRIQFADDETNPLDYSVSIGINAKGLIPGRDNDAMGIAYNYNKIRDTRLGDIFEFRDSAKVLELFYNIELTPAIFLNLDAQFTKGTFSSFDSATILGAQLQIRL